MGVESWDDLRIVSAILAEGSASAAARRLGLATSTVTRRIAALEQSLGAPLFHRTRDGLRATPAATALAGAAERMATEVARASAAVWPADAVAGTVRIATTEGIATMLAEQGVARLARAHPGLRIELLAGNAELDLATGEADLALRTLRPRAPDLRARKAAALHLWVVAAESFLAGRAPAGEADLAGLDVVLPAGELAALPEARWLAGLPGVRVCLATNSMPALYAAVRDGAGIGVVPEAWARRAGGLRLLFPAPVPPRELWLVTSELAAERAATRLVADRIVAWLAESASPGGP
jgi:DNA-binding transcriptional LysR family regulator